MDKSIGEYFYSPGVPEGHQCGYCKSEEGSISHGLWTHTLTVEDYQDLIDRGWRRSGKYCYKAVMSKTCCPLYTISCHATKFKLSKSQKGVLKTMKRYLLEGRREGGEQSSQCEASEAADKADTTKDIKHKGTATTSTPAKVKKVVQPGKGADPTKPPCRKAKELRKERKMEKMNKMGRPSETLQTSSIEPMEEGGGEGATEATSSDGTRLPSFMQRGEDGRKPLEEFLAPVTPPPTSSPSNPTSSKKPAHHLEMKLIRSCPPSPEFVATFGESHNLFRRYQMNIHKEKEEDCSEKCFTRFLCTSPLKAKDGLPGWPYGYGSYHQHYRIDGRLIAVGVIDILPKCLSSVYLYYDPDYDFLNLGVYSALRELELTRKLHLNDPENFKFYYMGYYVHSCQKMRYKGNYTPSFLLCPESYTFIPIEKCRPKLDISEYSRLNDEKTVSEDVSDWLGRTLVLINRTYMTYEEFSRHVAQGSRKEAEVRQYAELVGPQVATRMLLVLNS